MRLSSALLPASAAFAGVFGVASAFAPSTSSSVKVGIGHRPFGVSPVLHPAAVPAAAARSGTCLFMGWGPDPVWSPCSVLTNVDACPSGSCVELTVSVSPETAKDFTVPGQYVQVRPAGDDDAKPIFLAIASPPTGTKEGEEADAAAGGAQPTFEFLIKKTDNNDWVTAGTPQIEISQVLGGGFPISDNLDGFKYDFPTQNVLLFATGSGIAPIRSAIESGQLGVSAPGQGGRTARLYYGVRNVGDTPYANKFLEWEERGVEVVPVVSQPGEEWDGRSGYVQNALEEDGVPIPRNSGALMCGVNGMTDAVRELLTRAGVFEGRVMTNF